MNIHLKPAELDALMEEYDTDRNNLIDIDEFTQFVSKNVMPQNDLAASAVLKVSNG